MYSIMYNIMDIIEFRSNEIIIIVWYNYQVPSDNPYIIIGGHPCDNYQDEVIMVKLPIPRGPLVVILEDHPKFARKTWWSVRIILEAMGRSGNIMETTGKISQIVLISQRESSLFNKFNRESYWNVKHLGTYHYV